MKTYILLLVILSLSACSSMTEEEKRAKVLDDCVYHSVRTADAIDACTRASISIYPLERGEQE